MTARPRSLTRHKLFDSRPGPWPGLTNAKSIRDHPAISGQKPCLIGKRFLGDPVRIWRGTTGLTLEQSLHGIAWTVDRDVACWFAVCYWPTRRDVGAPLVITAEVPRSEILAYTDARGEREMVVFTGQRDVPGSTATWTIGSAQQLLSIASSRLTSGLAAR